MTAPQPGPGAASDPGAEPGRRGPAWAQGTSLVFRDGEGSLQVVALDALTALTIGRGSGCDLRLPWDERVSRLHAQLDRVGSDWTVVDDGLSRNGTFLNGERVTGRRRLRDGDTLLLGETSFGFRDARGATSQLQILTALCRPYKQETPYATPASNQQIAAEVYLSVDAVKTHLRTLFQKFHVEDLPQNQKRTKLVERAFALGVVSRRDL
jgi:DNA-binding CsgD family transcriptional regulator